MATSTRRAPLARAVRKAGRSVARLADKTAKAAAEKIELLNPNTAPERKIAISTTTKRTLTGKASDRDIVKAFGKKPSAPAKRARSSSEARVATSRRPR